MENLKLKMTSNQNKRNLKILRLYLIGLFLIALFFLLRNSSIISELVVKSTKLRYHGFVTVLLTGLLKDGLLVIGISIIVILSFLLIREKIKPE